MSLVSSKQVKIDLRFAEKWYVIYNEAKQK
jgi:hypothetical protein